MFRNDDLDELLACDRGPAVSIYLPTHQAGREVRQDEIRLRNLLAEAAKRLGKHHRAPEVAKLLQPAQRLVGDEAFWRHQDRGLAVFLAPGFDRIHKLPVEVSEELAIGRHFRIRPLLAVVDPADWYWVLTLTAGRARLYQGSRWSFAEMRGLDLPQGIDEIYDETVYEEAHYAAPTGRPSRGPAGLAKAQSFGPAPDELHKAQLIEFMRRVAAAVEPVIRRQPAPVILAATPEIDGNFRDLALWKDLLPDGIPENPDAMAAEELHRRAWDRVLPRQDKLRADALGRLHSLIGNRDPKAATRAEDIVKAAHYGRVDRLFLSDGAVLWGRFDEAQDRVVAHGSPADGDDDLFDYAALMTLRQGGPVTLVERAQLPPGAPAAAILRY
jgi:Bacterial archaeo-eukaryotic release factor family 3